MNQAQLFTPVNTVHGFPSKGGDISVATFIKKLNTILWLEANQNNDLVREHLLFVTCTI